MSVFRSIVNFKDFLIDDFQPKSVEELEKYFNETPNVAKFEIAETDADGYPSLIYIRYSFPMLLTDRYMILRPTHKRIDDKNLLQLCPHLIEHHRFPEIEGRVRIGGFNSSIFV